MLSQASKSNDMAIHKSSSIVIIYQSLQFEDPIVYDK
jgi:hypothetical protein